MNLLKRTLALLVALMMLLSAGMALAENTFDMSRIILTVNGKEYSADYLDNMAYQLYSYGYVETYPDYDYTIEYLYEQGVIESHLVEAGYLNFTAEEEAAFANEAAREWEDALNSYVEYYLSEDTAEARAALREQAAAYYESNGYNEAGLLENLKMQAAWEKLDADMTGGYVPTEDEIQNVFNEFGAQYAAMYADVGMYEFYTQYYGYESWYTPEGYRGVLQILLEVDESLLNAYAEAAGAYETEATEANKAAVDAAAAACVASRQEAIDAINTTMANGGSWLELIKEYNIDPGMEDETNLAEGYAVHRESIIYDPQFIAAAFDERMNQPGDWSNPSVGDYGIYVVYYLRDISGGLIMTDDIHAEIEEYLIGNAANNAYSAQMGAWAEKVEMNCDTDALAELKAQTVAE